MLLSWTSVLWLCFLWTAAAAAAPPGGESPFRPTALFGDHMVLQADQQHGAQLAGAAAPFAPVSLTAAMEGRAAMTLTTTAGADGQWIIAGIQGGMDEGPFVMTLRSGEHAVVAHDVWFGTV